MKSERKGYVSKGDFLINLAAMPIKEKEWSIIP
jgi:hypothetical protein